MKRILNGVCLLIDFDETISTKGRFPVPGEQIEASLEYVNRLYNEGYYIIIWTCRSDLHLLQAEQWLLNQGYMFDKINQARPHELLLFEGKDTRKIWGHTYIGDDSLSWKVNGMPHWSEIYEMVKMLKPHNCIPEND